MRVELGGPGPACSAARVRRLLAGEVAGPEGERLARHLDGCARCQEVQREVAAEKIDLLRAVPFEVFAAGVAEKLLVPAPRTRFLRWAAPLAAAAAVALVAGSVLLHRPAEEDGVRSKGGASVQLFLQDGQGVRELQSSDRIAAGARVQIFLHPGARKFAAAVLLEPGEASVLYDGAAVQGALPQSFEWTGAGQATLLVVLTDAPVAAAALHSPKDAPAGADILQVPLRR
jgi:hypothetical protein